jgi:hypothetical protein
MADPKKGQEPQPPAEPISGGPAATTPETTPAPKYVPLKHGGKEYQAPEEIAQAWEERERDYARKLNQNSDELGQLRKWKSTVEQQVSPKPTAPDLNTLWFENPTEAAKIIQEQTFQRVATEYEKREQARAQQDAENRFFEGFYRKHDDLRDDDDIVRLELQKHFNEVADLPVASAQDKLADFARGRIIALSRKVKTNETDSTRSRAGLSEPATGERPPRSTRSDEDDEPKSLGDVIKARAAARRHPSARSAARG